MTTSDRIVTPFGPEATADAVSDGINLVGKRAIVTGGASGIGIETSKALARRGAAVTLAVRNVAMGRQVADQIVAETGNNKVDVRQLELTDLRSVNTFTDGWSEPLHLLINNAGVMSIPERVVNDDGWEGQFATNFLGHFALTVGLHKALTDAVGARVVSVSSSAHLFSPVVFDDINFRFRPYDPLQAYAQSKTAVILFCVAAFDRWASEGITVNSLNPGAIVTPLQRHTGGKLATPLHLQKSPSQGAATTVLLATSPRLEGVGGRYFNDNQEAAPVDHRPSDVTDLVNSVADYALDSDAADRLWDLALQATR